MQPNPIPKSHQRAFDVALRIRHPSIDPKEITRELELEPEHCFKAGERRAPAGDSTLDRHPQTYWLAPLDPQLWRPLEPAFFDVLADRFSRNAEPVSHEQLEAARSHLQAVREMGTSSLEVVLSAVLARINLHHDFLKRLQAEGGEVLLLVTLNPQVTPRWTLNVPAARFLAKLGIEVSFELAEEA